MNGLFRFQNISHALYVLCFPICRFAGAVARLTGRAARRLRHAIHYLLAQCASADPWIKDDLFVAMNTMGYVVEGHSDPWRFAFWMRFGTIPEKAIPFWLEREAETDRLREAPRKPVQSEKPAARQQKAGA